MSAAITLACPQLQADDWYRWRGPHANGVSTETNWRHDWPGSTPKIAWRAEVGTGFSSFVISDGRAFTVGYADEQNTLFSFDATTGKLCWKYAYAATLDDRDFEGGSTSTPTVDGDRIYMLTRPGALLCLQAADGQLLWEKQMAEVAEVRLPGWGFAGAPLVVGEKLILNMGESGVAVNKKDGSLLWSSSNKEAGYATPVLVERGDAKQVLLASSRAYIGVDLETGSQQWIERWLTSFGCNAADPIVHEGKMFLSSGYNRGAALYQLGGPKPELIWKSKEMQNQLHSSLLFEGHLYGIDGNMEAGARLRCLVWSTGEVKWSEDELRPGGLAFAGGKLILLTDSGELVIAAATADGFEEQARGQVLNGKCWTVPVLSNGLLYCRSVDGQVACVDLRP
jgi:outer membrane protein assembly factor BamB